MRIINPSKTYTPGATKAYFDVADPKSHDYERMTQQDYELRIWQEITEYNEADGLCVFASLTYREQCLPRFNTIDPVTGKAYSIPCFSAADKNKFLSDIRNELDHKYGLRGPSKKPHPKKNRYGKEIKEMSKAFRYIWSCEYGTSDVYTDDRGTIRVATHRSHYHSIFFCPKEMVEALGWRRNGFVDQEKIKKFFEQFWDFGMIRWSEPDLGICVQSPFAAVYVAKYCFKDVDWYGQPEVMDYLYDDEGKIIKDHYELIKDKLPKHWQSKQFGAGLVSHFDSLEALRDGVDFHFPGNVMKGITSKHKAPRYIKRKIMYVTDSSGRYYLNDKGLSYQVALFPDKHKKLSRKLKNAFTRMMLEKYLASDEECLKLTGLHNRDSVQKYIQSLMNGRSFEELALYSLVWRGLYKLQPSLKRPSKEFDSLCVKSFNIDKEFSYINNLSYDEFYELSSEQYSLNLLAHQNATVSTLDEKGFFKTIDRNLYEKRNSN